MEQEKILSELKTKIGKTALSEQTLQAYVSLNLPSEGTEPDEAYWEKHTKILDSMSRNLQGQLNKEMAEFAKKNNPKKDGKTAPEEEKPGEHGTGNETRENEALSRIEKLEQLLEARDKQLKEETLLRSVSEKGAELQVSNQALWRDAVRLTPITDGMSEDDLLAAAKKNYESKLKAYMGNGAVPYSGTSGSGTGGDDGKEALDAFFSKKVKEGKFPSKN